MRLRTMLIAGIIMIAVVAYYATLLGSESGTVPESAYAAPVLGDDSARITIEEWGDYQCTYCKRFHSTSLRTIMSDYVETGQVKLTFMDFPLNGPDSVLAASASHCAGDQDAYWEYHDELYSNWAGENTGWISPASLKAYAADINLDTEMFAECLGSSKHRDRVLDTYAYGQSKGINSTPSFLISDGEKTFKIRGNQPLDVFVRVFDEL